MAGSGPNCSDSASAKPLLVAVSGRARKTPKRIGPAVWRGQAFLRKSQDSTQNRGKKSTSNVGLKPERRVARGRFDPAPVCVGPADSQRARSFVDTRHPPAWMRRPPCAGAQASGQPAADQRLHFVTRPARSILDSRGLSPVAWGCRWACYDPSWQQGGTGDTPQEIV